MNEDREKREKNSKLGRQKRESKPRPVHIKSCMMVGACSVLYS